MRGETRHRVLVVEDSATQAAAITALLRSNDFDVTAVRSGEEALERIGGGYDVVLTDIVMPGISGYEVCSRLNSDPSFPKVPVVLMTGLGDPRDIIRGLECGAASYITKPYDPEYLVARLRHVIANRQIRQSRPTTDGVGVMFMGEAHHVSADRETILDLCLSSYEELVRTTQAVQSAERRARFVADASRVLASSLDYETTLQSIARLAVPELADICVVDTLAADGTVQRVAVVPDDPSHAAIIERIHERYPPEADGDHPVARAMRTGQSVLDAALEERRKEEITTYRNDDHHDLLRALGFRSYMVVPLVARERVLGAVSFISSDSGRQYRRDDLIVAEDLARRAAMAIDNARLVDDLQRSRTALEAERVEAERARIEAERANQSKSEFLAMMSHELRTPLNAISGYAQLLRDGVNGPVTDEQRRSLVRIERNGAHLLSLINDVLNFAKLEAGRIELQLDAVPVDETLAGVEALIRPQVEAKGLRYVYESGPADVAACADYEKLLQIVLNLLTNAVKFTEPGGSVLLSWGKAGEDVLISVADTGVGIAADRLASVFEPFVQVAERYRRENEGVGLGLAISRDLARAMGGELQAVSEPGRGSTFTLSVPLWRADRE